jgi:hypothetical protein
MVMLKVHQGKKNKKKLKQFLLSKKTILFDSLTTGIPLIAQSGL